MNQEAAELAIKDGHKPTIPDKFMKVSSWMTFKESFVAHLDQLRGSNMVPLSYVVRTDHNPNPAAIYDTDRDRRMATVPLTGHDFNKDNETVFAILKELTMSGPAWNWIEPFNRRRNGRACFEALVAHYEGTSMMNHAKDKAYNDIATASYSGMKKTQTFEAYTSVHKKAHTTLEKHGEPVPPGKKVRDYLKGIQQSAGQGLLTAVVQCYACPIKLNDFDLASNFLIQFATGEAIRNDDHCCCRHP
jgi:hypothetical protein